MFSCEWAIPQLPFRHSENQILTQRSVLAVSSQIFLPKKWSEHHRRDDGEQQPISSVEREFGAESHGKRHGLEVIHSLMQAWGQPQCKYPTIHVAGSKGKGSTVAILTSILRAAGYRVGSYTSPSLTHFGERIQVNGSPISDALAQRYVDEIVELIGSLPDRPRFFEATTAIAFQHFARECVDVAVIEVGLGGRLDATNVIHPALAIITSIELEHTQVLGDTCAAIAAEKAGIVKTGCPTVTAVVDREPLEVIERICTERGSNLWRLRDHFEIDNIRSGVAHQQFDLHLGSELGGGRMSDLVLGLAGEAQCGNAALAVIAAHLLRDQFNRISEHSIRHGLHNVQWPGRLELTDGRPAILLDVAHTPASARQLRQHLDRFFDSVPKTLVIGMLRDKKHGDVAAELAGAFDRVHVAPVKWFRSLEAQQLYDAFRPYHECIELAPTICAALDVAVRTTPSNGLVVVAGSLFAVGEVKRGGMRG
jgi:dihydrofolate synthase/folylpolyglutamate synthase